MFRKTRKRRHLLVLLALLTCSLTQGCIQKSKSGETDSQEAVVAGGPDSFMEIRHIVLKGTNYGIGRKIAEMAKEAGVRISPSRDSLRNRVQREYMAKNYPILYERMKGVADAYGLNIEDDAYDFSRLSQYPSGRPGCSVVFYPGGFTEDSHDMLSRNYDFSTGTWSGRRPGENQMAVMSRPYVFEMYPEGGYASLSLYAFDLLGGVLDGMNSEGLAVAVLADAETISKYGSKPTAGIGMHELLSMRYLLDNCRDVEEAKEAMLSLKHYYAYIPCHYIVADKTGQSFVFEFSSLRNAVFIVDGEGPQCVTNHLLSSFEPTEQLPEEGPTESHDRLRTIHSAIAGKTQLRIDEIKAVNALVQNKGMAFDHPDYAPNRTLWYSLYDLDKRSMSIKFYLGEKPDPADEGKKIVDYSSNLTFQLKPGD